MRVSKEEKEKTKVKIIEQAAYLFRENGIESTSVNDVMAAAGLTHGGFYRHFSSKTRLVEAALNKAFDDRVTMLETNIEKLGAEQALARFIKLYLSNHHVSNIGKGCPIAALGNELDREAGGCGVTMEARTDELITILAKGFEGTRTQTNKRATALLSSLVGTIILARQARDEKQIKVILTAGRNLAGLCWAL